MREQKRVQVARHRRRSIVGYVSRGAEDCGLDRLRIRSPIFNGVIQVGDNVIFVTETHGRSLQVERAGKNQIVLRTQ